MLDGRGLEGGRRWRSGCLVDLVSSIGVEGNPWVHASVGLKHCSVNILSNICSLPAFFSFRRVLMTS